MTEKVAISDIADINPKLSPSKKIKADDLISFVSMAALSEETQKIEDPIDRPYSEVAKGYTPFKRGDILIAKITPCFENGKIAYSSNLPREYGFGSTEFHILRPQESLFGRYLYHILREPFVRTAGQLKMKGASGHRRVPSDFFAKLKIPLPPLEEQKRIAAILDAADELRAKRRKSIDLLDSLVQSVFLDMFGDPVTNPKGWDQTKLGDLLKVKSGDGLVAKDMAPNGRFPVYGGNGITGYHDSYMFEEPRIIIGRVGAYCGSVYLTRPNSWVTDNALYVQELFKNIDALYLLFALKFANLNQYAGRAAQPLISGSRIYRVSIFLPPLDLQRRFKESVRIMEAQESLLNEHLAELERLFASLQSRAFRGEL